MVVVQAIEWARGVACVARCGQDASSLGHAGPLAGLAYASSPQEAAKFSDRQC